MKNDTFNGDNAKLVESIKALLALDESGSLVPHGVGGHARQLLSAAASRLSASIADTAPVFRCNDCGGFDIEQVPETMKPESIADTAGAKPVSAEHVTIRRDLLQDLIDDVSDYAVSREFKQRESQWRTQLLESARAALATHAPLSDEPVAWIDKRLLALLPKYYVDVILAGHKVSTDHVPLYTAPQAECAPREAQPVAVMWFEPGSGKPNFAGTGDTVEAGTWERGTKLYAAPTPERADADTAGAKLEGGEWRAIFNSARSPDATFEQFCGWMREEIAATPASSVADAAGASEGQAETPSEAEKMCERLGAAVANVSAENAALRERIAGMEKDAAWIGVDERLPNNDQTVAFVVKADRESTNWYLNGHVLGGTYHENWGFSTPGVGHRASHWMPLPEAPASSVVSKEEGV